MKDVLIIYHREDNDGLFSAAIAENAINEKHDTTFAYMPMDYNGMKSINKESIDYWAAEYDTVVMTDISFSDDEMMKYLVDSLGNRLIWIDHHLPAIAASVENGYDDIPGERATGRSAILLAFKYFFDKDDAMYNANKVPELFRILSAWDSFTFEKEGYSLDDVRTINIGVTQDMKLDYDVVYDIVDDIINDWKTVSDKTKNYSDALIEHFMSVGDMYINFEDNTWHNIINEYGDFSWNVDGHSACVLFLQGHTSHFVFQSIASKVRHGVVFKRMSDGNWVMSLYNTNNDDTFHCGEYLKKKYCGGGHAGAAGCVLTQEQFIKLLNAKTI